MLDACRLAGLSALETHYADVNAPTQCGCERWRCVDKLARMRGPGESFSHVIMRLAAANAASRPPLAGNFAGSPPPKAAVRPIRLVSGRCRFRPPLTPSRRAALKGSPADAASARA
jgi:hypothetical protein